MFGCWAAGCSVTYPICKLLVIHAITLIQVWVTPLLITNMNLLCSCTSWNTNQRERQDVYADWNCYCFFFLFAEVEAKRSSSSAHGERPLPRQPEHERSSGHHSVSPADGRPIMGATSYRLRRVLEKDTGWSSEFLLRDGRNKTLLFPHVNLWLLILRPCWDKPHEVFCVQCFILRWCSESSMYSKLSNENVALFTSLFLFRLQPIMPFHLEAIWGVQRVTVKLYPNKSSIKVTAFVKRPSFRGRE